MVIAKKSKVFMASVRLDAVNLAEFLKAKRAELDLSRREAARRIGISHAYLTNLEAGVNPTTGRQYSLTTDTLEAISRAYRVPYEALDRIARGVQSEPKMPEVDAQTREALDLLNALPPDDREELIELAKLRLRRREARRKADPR